jgi:hypothetical protein
MESCGAIMSNIADVGFGEGESPRAVIAADGLASNEISGPPDACVAAPTAAPDKPVNDTVAGAASSDTAKVGAKNPRRLDEISQAKRSFATIMEEADVAIRVFDQEKRRILGITYALSQIEQSFGRLCAKFEALEKRVDSVTAVDAEVRARFESALESIRTRDDREAELLRDNVTLRGALANVERQLVRYADDVRAVGEDNGTLRQKISAMECDTGLILDEIGHLRDDITILSSAGEPPLPANVNARPDEDIVALMTGEPPYAPESEDDGVDDDYEGGIPAAIAVTRNESAPGRARSESVRFADESAAAPHRAAPASRREMSVPPVAAHEPAMCGHELTELKSLLKSYQEVIRNLDLARGRELPANPPELDDIASDPVVMAIVGPPPAATRGSNAAANRGHAAPVRENVAPDLNGELQRERQERRLTEDALRTARQERAQLQRELARIKAAQPRAPSADADGAAVRPRPERPAVPGKSLAR